MKISRRIPRYLVLLLASLSVQSCKDKKEAKFPYLKPTMNETAAVSRAELEALQFTNNTGGNQGFGIVIGNESYPTLRSEHTEVHFLREKILLRIQVNVLAKESQRWVETSTPQERKEVIEKKICIPFIVELSRQLECDPALISMQWSSGNARVEGTVEGSSLAISPNPGK